MAEKHVTITRDGVTKIYEYLEDQNNVVAGDFLYIDEEMFRVDSFDHTHCCVDLSSDDGCLFSQTFDQVYRYKYSYYKLITKDDIDKKIESQKDNMRRCGCESRDLFWFGCRCGGV